MKVEPKFPTVVTQTVHEHVVVDPSGLIIKRCGIPHSEPYDWRECPIANNWTLLNIR